MKTENIHFEIYPPRQSGGQQVGVVSKGIKATHLPTGLQVVCDAARSQFQNKKIATSMIEWGLIELGYKDE